jgi:hypothetical protein
MRSILKMLVFLTIAWLGGAAPAHAQWVDECLDGEKYTIIMDLENGEAWKDSEEYESVYLMFLEAPEELRLGALKLYVTRVKSVDFSGSPAGVAALSHDSILIGDGFFSEEYKAYQQRIINHELAHIWAFNHLCALEDFAAIGWESISDEGRSGARRSGAVFPERDLEPHDYATYSPQEDFAVSVEMYIEDPEGFTEKYPERGKWLAEHLFTDSGCPTEFSCEDLLDYLKRYETDVEEDEKEYGPERDPKDPYPEDGDGELGDGEEIL